MTYQAPRQRTVCVHTDLIEGELLELRMACGHRAQKIWVKTFRPRAGAVHDQPQAA